MERMLTMRMPIYIAALALGALAATAFAAVPSVAQAPVIEGVKRNALPDHPVSFDDLQAMRMVPSGDLGSPPQPTRDGMLIAYLIQPNIAIIETYARQGGERGVPFWFHGAQIWLADVAAGSSANITGGIGSNWGSAWSPDDQSLAFYSNRSGATGVWVWDRRTHALRMVAEVGVEPSANGVLQWFADGRRLMAEVAPEGGGGGRSADHSHAHSSMPNVDRPTSTYTEATYLTTGSGTPQTYEPFPTDSTLVHDLAVIDVKTRQVRRLARNVLPTWYHLSPDGRRMAYSVRTAILGGDVNNTVAFEIAVVDVATQQRRIVVPRALMNFGGLSITWSPDGSRLAYFGGDVDRLPDGTPRERGLSASGRCYVVRADGSTGAVDIGTGRVSRTSTPIWDSTGEYLYTIDRYNGSTVVRLNLADGTISTVAAVPGHEIERIVSPWQTGSLWSPDGRSLYVQTRDTVTGNNGVYRITLADGALHRVVEEPTTDGEIGVAPGSAVAGFVSEGATNPNELWVSDQTLERRRQFSHINDQFRQPVEVREVRWLDADGDSLRGALLLPVGYQPGRRYPMIVWVYAGERTGTNQINHFGVGAVAGGDAGYNLLPLAARGYVVFVPDNPGHFGTPMLDVAKTVLPGVNRVVELGIADPDRLGVWGQSNGGFGTLALLVQTTRFKAAVAAAGVYNAVLYYGVGGVNEKWFEQGDGRLGGSPWAFRDRYIENSPYWYADRVTTPVLIEVGDDDADAADSRVLFNGLKRLGKTTALLAYKSEGHSLANATNWSDYWSHVIAWFDRYLSPGGGR